MLMNNKFKFLGVVLMLLLHQFTFAQSRVVTGVVTDASTSESIPGVNVILKGSTNGTITDIDGKFSVNVSSDETILVFSFIGYESQETAVGSRSIINVSLQTSTIGLEEVVVVSVGYGSMKKSDLSGASVSISADKLKGAAITNLDQALQGRAAGVTAVHTTGQPGASVSIRIRGQSTINASAEPLYVIDGVQVSNTSNSGSSLGLGDALGNGATSGISPLSAINPNDILSMEILKDASATAIYGSQGANGVVIITTKRGKSGDAKFSYEGSYGVQRQKERLDIMNLQEFADYSISISSETDGREDRIEFLDPSILGKGTNWQDAVFQLATIQQHQVSVSGGSDHVRYYVSGSYLDQEGTIIGSEFNRYSFRTNLDADLKRWLKMGVNVSYSETDESLGLADSDEGIIKIALQTTPDVPIYNLDGSYASMQREGMTGRVNPIGKALDEDNLLGRSSLSGSIFFDVTLMEDVVFHTEASLTVDRSKAEIFRPKVQYGAWRRDVNSSRIQNNKNEFWQVKNYITYTKSFGKHNTSIMVGQDSWESSYEYESISGKNLPSNDVHNPSLGADPPQISSGFGSSSNISFLGRATYNYGDRYYATYTYRYDGSSNFGPENRWAGFHAAAGSWRISNETWFKPARDVVNNMKFRLGWGQVGNQNLGSYRWGSSISKMETGLGAGYRQFNIANPYIKWETQEQWNIGLDMSFFDSRFSIVAEVYDKTSRDMLMEMQLPSYMGTRGNVSSALAAPWGNYGEINNKGIEISLTSHNIKTDSFEWNTDFQISHNKNKLVALDGTPAAHIEGYGQWSDVVSLTRIGQPLFNFYGYKTDGIYQNKADLESSPKPAKYPADGNFNRSNTVYVGDIKYKDLSGPDGKPDGIIDEYDKTDIGSPMPKFTFGFNNTFIYKNFDLSVFINGSYGNKLMNYLSIGLSDMKSQWNNQLAVGNNRARLELIDSDLTYPRVNSQGVTVDNWYDDVDNVRVANSGTNVPRAIGSDPNDNDRISDRYIEDGSYIRIKNITLGYTVPKRIVEKYHLSNVRFYGSVQNLATFTDYSGFDPEIGASTANANVYGLDNGRYPSPQAFTFGINVSF